MNLKKEIKIVHENHEKCIEIIEKSFLKNYFSETLTDIQYNGSDFFGQDNELGRYKLDITISNEEVFSILCQLANYALKPFSSQYPILDIAFGNYRLSAMHPSLARNNNEKVTTFSIRKIQPSLKIKDNDKIPPEEKEKRIKKLEEQIKKLEEQKRKMKKKESEDPAKENEADKDMDPEKGNNINIRV